MSFDLSQGLFSSAGIDAGTQLLLKVFSRFLDEDRMAGRPPPRRVLDAGCGTGIIGICAAVALAPSGAVHVRCQDRDELARLITLHNAAKNGISPTVLSAHTEPLLNGASGWDMILSNIPAKAGSPVLEDFVRRSASQLNDGGRVILVAVKPLADFFREQIHAIADLTREENGHGHTVFVYSRRGQEGGMEKLEAAVDIHRIPDSCYQRAVVTCPIEDIPIRLKTIYGAEGFDRPGGAVIAGAKLVRNLGRGQFLTDGPFLIHEPGQGFFPCWLFPFLPCNITTVLSGRNILALETSRYNMANNGCDTVLVVPAVDLSLGKQRLWEAANNRRYTGIAAFPDLLPQSSLPQGTDQLAIIWESIPPLLAPGGVFLAAFSSSDAERFDRKKSSGFTRLGNVKRHGFRALAYRLT